MARTDLLDGTTTDRPSLAAGLMLFALFTLAFQDGMIRIAAPETSIWTFQVIRSTSNLMLILVLARVLWGGLPKRPKVLWPVILRSLCLLTAMFCFFGGVEYLTLAEMAAGLYTFPIFVTILSWLILRERIGIARISAVAIGAIGALLILQPGSSDFSPIKLLPVGAGLAYAGVIILTRRWCRGESPVTLALGVAIAFGSAGSLGLVTLTWSPLPAEIEAAIPYLTRGWVPPSLEIVMIALLCSVLNLSSNIALAKAYQSAEASWLAPFDYSYLIFATLWGWILFTDLPDLWMGLGMTLIAVAGIFTAWRENQKNRSSRIELAAGRR
ncbi:MAG: DMT family transporter [Pseudomonadota bacterium]